MRKTTKLKAPPEPARVPVIAGQVLFYRGATYLPGQTLYVEPEEARDLIMQSYVTAKA